MTYLQAEKPIPENAYIERFNLHFRNDVLYSYLFKTTSSSTGWPNASARISTAILPTLATEEGYHLRSLGSADWRKLVNYKLSSFR